ncbi:MAG: DUF4403 family protein [Hyphomicrobiaceae bacterium]
MQSHFWPRVGSFCVRAGFIALIAATSGCKQEVQLTRAPSVGPPPAVPVRRDPTVISLGLAIDLKAAAAIADKAVPESLGRLVEWFDDAACAKRTKWVECNGAKAEVDVLRNGPVTLVAEDGRIALKVPLKYALSARGLGWASFIRESRNGEVVATIPIEAGLAAGFEPDIRLKDPVVMSERTIPVLKAKLALGKSLDARLKKPLAPVIESIRESIRAKGLRNVAERAWRSLYTPIELGRDPQLWLRIEPDRIVGADFAAEGDELLFRYSIGARLTVAAGQRPAPMLPRPLPETARGPAQGVNLTKVITDKAGAEPSTPKPHATTELRLPITIGSEPLLKALKEAFAANEVLKSAPSPEAQPIGTKVRNVSLFPARGQLGIELHLDIVEPTRWAGMVGTAHFLARPVIRPNGVLELEGVGLPDSGAKPVRGEKKAPPSPNVPRIGAEPYAGRIAQAGRMTVSNAIRDVLPHANAMIEQPLGDGIALGGRFDEVKIIQVEPVRDGFEITFSLTGNLTLRYSADQALAAPVQPEPATR